MGRTVVAFVVGLLAAGCAARRPRAPAREARNEEREAPSAAEATRWGFGVADLVRVELLSGGGKVRLAVPRHHWGQMVAALGSATEATEPGPSAPRSPALRFALKSGGELTLELVGREHWRLVGGDRETPLGPCPALKAAAGVALRLACASGADLIVVAKVVPRLDGGEPGMEVVRTLKGSAVAGARLSVEGEALPAPGGPDALCLALLRVESDGVGAPRTHRLLPVGTLWEHNDGSEAKLRESIPLPDAWGKAVRGLRMGLRARESEIEPGGELPVEVCIQNVGKEPIALRQHRMSVYDCYPYTRFAVKVPGGGKCELAKPVTTMDELDAPLVRTLQPGEVYIHTVRLNLWGAATLDAPTSPRGRGAFWLPGRYEINCTYSVTAGGRESAHWSGTLRASPITVRVRPERREGRDPGGLV